MKFVFPFTFFSEVEIMLIFWFNKSFIILFMMSCFLILNVCLFLSINQRYEYFFYFQTFYKKNTK